MRSQLGRLCGNAPSNRGDDIYATLYQIASERRQALEATFRKPIDNREVLSLHIAYFA